MRNSFARSRIGLLFLTVICTLFLFSSSQWGENPLPALAASQRETTQADVAQTVPSDSAPQLLQSSPDDLSNWRGGALVFTFDRALNPAAANLVVFSPALPGTATIADEDLIFTPDEPPVPGTTYTVRFQVQAADAPRGEPWTTVELSVVAQMPLLVTSTQPSDGATEVDTDSQILIAFNRPVVALSGVDDQADLPVPIQITPEIAGEGQWIGTSIYRFQPDTAFAGDTSYTIQISELTAVDGSSLETPTTVRFTTAQPIVMESSPFGALIRPDTSVRVRFSQPVDQPTTEEIFSLHRLVDESNGTATSSLDGEFDWIENGRTLLFTPTAMLEFGTEYVLSIDGTSADTNQTGLYRGRYRETFTTVPLPGVDLTIPADGDTEVTPDSSITIRFTAPVSPALVLPNISLQPMLTTTQVYSFYSDYLNELLISWYKEPNTRYTVTVGSGVGDEYGNTLGEDYVATFTTGDFNPFARLEAQRFTHFTSVTDTRVSVLYRNVADVKIDLYQLDQTELFRLTGSNSWDIWQNYEIPEPEARRIWSRTYEAVEEQNISVRQVVTLTAANGEELSPGIYFVEVDQPVNQDESGAPIISEGRQAVVIVSDLNVLLKKSEQGASLVWLTDLLSGQPAADQDVRFYQESTLVGEGTTDVDGLLQLDLDLITDRTWTPILAVVGEPGSERFGVVSSDWSDGIAIWDFNLNGGYSLDPVVSHFYTDRPIYRPGQEVYWKGIVRKLVDESYVLPSDNIEISINLRDPQGTVIMQETATLNELGTINGRITLSDEALTGGYYLDAQIIEGNQISGNGTNFMVASYRKPEFEITVDSSQDEYVQGDMVEVTLQANYFSGGPLANAPITWRSYASPYFFQWDDAPRDRFYSFMPFDPDDTNYDPFRGSFYLGLIREGTGTTNADGSFTLELPTELVAAAQAQQWTFDFTVQSSSDQFSSANLVLPVHAAEFYIGVSSRENILTAGDVNTVDLITISPTGTVVADTSLDIIVYDYIWNSVYILGPDGTYRWESTIERTPVHTTTVETDSQGQASFSWMPPNGGQYQIGASATDSRGNKTNSSGFVWVSAANPDEFVSWPRANNDRIELVADKALYEPGDTAQLLVPSPFMGESIALVSVERNGIISSEVITLAGTSAIVDIPIDETYLPNVFVSVVLAKGVDETNPTPAMRYGYAPLKVDTASKALTVTVETSSEQVQPGETVSFTVTTRNHVGDPVEDAELSLALVDRAVLALRFEPDRPLMDVFYYERPLSIQTASLLTINRDRMSQQLSEGAKGGGGGDGGFDMQIREDFPDIAYWSATSTTDERGQAVFSVALPDNLTAWRLTAKAVTDETEVGNATHDIIATKPLQLRPVLPRFFTDGDQAQIGAVILNTTQDTLPTATVRLEIDGATVDASSPTKQEFSLSGADPYRANWPISIEPATTQVVVTMTTSATSSASGNGLSDAVRMVIPVVRYETDETVATAGVVPPVGIVEALRVPANATDQGSLQITLEPGLASGLVAGLDYLKDYPYFGNEQTVSSFLPNLFTQQAMETIGVDNPLLDANLEQLNATAVQRLINRQNQDGGWGYWPGERSALFISAYVLWGLHSADTSGYTVPAETIQRAVDYLERSFVAPSNVKTTWQLNEIAFIHFVLAEMGQGDPGRAGTLYDVRERLSHYGKALLAMALADMQPDGVDDARVDTLLNDLYGAANVTGTSAWWQEDSIDFRTLNSDPRTTAMVIAAFVRLDPQNPLLPQAIRWLMETRTAGYWPSTQETAWSLIALSDWIDLTGEYGSSYAWNVSLNSESLGQGEVAADTVNLPIELRVAVQDLLRDELNRLSIESTGSSGALYYTTNLNYFLDSASVSARDHGIVIDRRFELIDGGQSPQINEAAIGDVISVTVTIIAPTDLYHLRVDVPIPAGTEPIDPNLETTSDFFNEQSFFEDVEPVQWWRQWIPTYTDIRDDKVGLMATFLPAGTYEYTFNVQATLAGEFNVLPAHGEQLYFSEVWGRSDSTRFIVLDESTSPAE